MLKHNDSLSPGELLAHKGASLSEAEEIIVEGGAELEGNIKIGGSKNASLPILISSLLTDDRVYLSNIPRIKDVFTILEILKERGVDVHMDSSGNVKMQTSPDCWSQQIEPELASMLRVSILLLGPQVARGKHSEIPLPGGCNIGNRPFDLHLEGLQALGAKVRLKRGCFEVNAGKLHGKRVHLRYPSVGATENVLMAATLAKGKTLIVNAARDPEIVDLSNFLNSMGANIKGAGTNIIEIVGVKELHGTSYTVIPDRLEAGTYSIAAAITAGELILRDIIHDQLATIFGKLEEAGVRIRKQDEDEALVKGGQRLKATSAHTEPYPGFPTDLQPLFAVLMSKAYGTSYVVENVYESRFKYVRELKRMGARINVEGKKAIIKGPCRLKGNYVVADDIRGGAALVIAGLVAEGETRVSQPAHIDRGYEAIDKKLFKVGAKIGRTRCITDY